VIRMKQFLLAILVVLSAGCLLMACVEQENVGWVSVEVEDYFTHFDPELWQEQDSTILLLAGRVIVRSDIEWILSVDVDNRENSFLKVIFLSDSLIEMGNSIKGEGDEEIYFNYHLLNLQDYPLTDIVTVRYTITEADL